MYIYIRYASRPFLRQDRALGTLLNVSVCFSFLVFFFFQRSFKINVRERVEELVLKVGKMIPWAHVSKENNYAVYLRSTYISIELKGARFRKHFRIKILKYTCYFVRICSDTLVSLHSRLQPAVFIPVFVSATSAIVFSI